MRPNLPQSSRFSHRCTTGVFYLPNDSITGGKKESWRPQRSEIFLGGILFVTNAARLLCHWLLIASSTFTNEDTQLRVTSYPRNSKYQVIWSDISRAGKTREFYSDYTLNMREKRLTKNVRDLFMFLNSRVRLEYSFRLFLNSPKHIFNIEPLLDSSW